MKKVNFKNMTAAEKAQLILWLGGNRELCETSTVAKVAREYHVAAGIPISEDSMRTYREAVWPNLTPPPPPVRRKRINGAKVNAALAALDKRLTFLESSLGVKGE